MFALKTEVFLQAAVSLLGKKGNNTIEKFECSFLSVLRLCSFPIILEIHTVTSVIVLAKMTPSASKSTQARETAFCGTSHSTTWALICL